MGQPVCRVTWRDACTIGAATGSATRDGDPLVFSNSDDPFTTRTRLVVVEPKSGFRFIGTQIVSPPPAMPFDQMYTRGVNEAGFAYTWASLNPESEPTFADAIGIPYSQFGTLLLSSATSVSDAIALLDAYPRAYHGNFLFADAAGEIALVEISTRSYNVETRLIDGAFARTNHWISEEMAGVGAPEPGKSSAWRYRRACELVDRLSGSFDVEAMRLITSDHEGKDADGYSICAHGGGDPKWLYRGGSVSSEIIEPRLRRLWFCYGWPCGSAPEDPERQLYQDRSWGAYLPFDLVMLEPGEYVTVDGRLTALAVGYLARIASRVAVALGVTRFGTSA
ncbi:MAG TPA: C45 family autoproteolytic acyltransferase/hydrolase [Thermomicrobiales bacterium]|jgi:hypothetical protein